MIESRAQSSASIRLWLYTNQIERMALFYEILGFGTVEENDSADEPYLVMALRNNAGVQIGLATPHNERAAQRVGKQFFSLTTSLDPQVTYKVLSARGFDVGEYSASVNEQFVANDPEGNEVFIGSVRPQAPWDGWSNKSFKPNPLRGSA
jgi:hypothetical protein